MNSAKTAEPIKMPFEEQTRVRGSRNHVLEGGRPTCGHNLANMI